MTDEQQGFLQALSDLRSWHRQQVEQARSDVRVMQPHEQAIFWLHQLSALIRQHAAVDEVERRRARAANSQTGMPGV